jgi:hypothetical protein
MNSSHILICKLVFLINIIIQNYSVNCIPIADDGEFYDKNRKINKPDDHYVCDVDPNRKMCSIVNSFWISESNDFGCFDENIIVDKVNDLNDQFSSGFIIPIGTDNKISREQKTSKVCKIIRK